MDIKDIIGKTFSMVWAVKEDSEHPDQIRFICDDGRKYRMYHNQDCCEDVTLDDISGDLQDLIGIPILVAEERTNKNVGGEKECYRGMDRDSYTWIFYEIATVKGSVNIKWYGCSNGYYSEKVDFEEIGGTCNVNPFL